MFWLSDATSMIQVRLLTSLYFTVFFFSFLRNSLYATQYQLFDGQLESI